MSEENKEFKNIFKMKTATLEDYVKKIREQEEKKEEQKK